MIKLTNKKKWDEMTEREKIFYVMDRIDYYKAIGNKDQLDFWIYVLENYLDVEYNM